ncbi:unnamed protein product, partial [Chrysoparadoxa australica]
MLSTIQSGPAFFCEGISAIGISCSKQVLVINIWHLFLIIVIFCMVTTVTYFFRRHKQLHHQHVLSDMQTPYGAAPESRTIRINPHALAKALDLSGYEELNRMAAAKKLNEKYGDKFFVVSFYESGKRLFTREVKIRAWYRKLQDAEFQLDPVTLDLLKAGSASKEDDELGDSYGADGIFHIYFRPVKIWDIRHWLNHPSRENRLALY